MSNIDYEEGWGSGDNLSTLDKINIIRQKFSTDDENLLVNAVFSRITGINQQTISAWKNAKKDIQSGKKADICKAFNLRYQVWTDQFKSYEENVFYKKLDAYLLDNEKLDEQTLKEEDTSHLDAHMYDAVVTLSAEEEDELAFFGKDKTISLPGNLERYSPDFMYALAELLKRKGQAKDALYVLDMLEQSTHSFKYLHRKEIAHLKAILLSEKSIQKWDDAIEILRYLYADRYHLEVPEVVTLTASNYKRKALYHPNGMPNHADHVDLDALGASLSLYSEAYALKSDDQKYYDGINIAYIERILDALESDESENVTTKELQKLFNELYNGKEVNLSDWWEVTSKVEFYILLGDDASAVELYEGYKGTPTRFQLETSLRQLELYTHFCPQDDKAKGFMGMLRGEMK